MVQETHFIYKKDVRVVESDFVVFSTFRDHFSGGVSLVVGRDPKVEVDVICTGTADWLVVADVAVKCSRLRVYEPNCSAIRRFGPYLSSPKRIVFIGE